MNISESLCLHICFKTNNDDDDDDDDDDRNRDHPQPQTQHKKPFTLMDALFASSGGADSLKFIKTLRLLRFLKLVRLFKVEDMLGSLEDDVKDRVEDFMQDGRTKSAVMMLSIVVKTAVINHMLACIWTLIGRVGSVNGRDNWLEYEVLGPFDANDTEGGPNVGSIYLAAFYVRTAKGLFVFFSFFHFFSFLSMINHEISSTVTIIL